MSSDEITRILVAISNLSLEIGHIKLELSQQTKERNEWRKELASKFSSKWVEWLAKGAVGAILTTIMYKVMQVLFVSGGAVTAFHLINKYYA